MPQGLKESDKLPEPLFTPTTKADEGHDESITVEQMANIVGTDLTKQIQENRFQAQEVMSCLSKWPKNQLADYHKKLLFC